MNTRPFAERSGIVGNTAIEPNGVSISGALGQLFQAFHGENGDTHVAFSVDMRQGQPTLIRPFLDPLLKKGTLEYRQHELEVYSFLSRVAGFAGDASAHLSFHESEPPYFVTEAAPLKLCLGIQAMRNPAGRSAA